jgi:hypothetical protein
VPHSLLQLLLTLQLQLQLEQPQLQLLVVLAGLAAAAAAAAEVLLQGVAELLWPLLLQLPHCGSLHLTHPCTSAAAGAGCSAAA